MNQKELRSIELDVREDLRKKIEPFKKIMDAVQSLKDGDRLILHTTFKPVPLIRILKLKGYACETTKKEADHWICIFYKNKEGRKSPANENISADSTNPEPKIHRLDNRGLIPPEPMVRTLNQLEKAKPGDQVVIWNDRVPVYLLEELDSLGYSYKIDQKDDGSAEVTIYKSHSNGK
jgi:uncharacterized protein (DUF2249 family)